MTVWSAVRSRWRRRPPDDEAAEDAVAELRRAWRDAGPPPTVTDLAEAFARRGPVPFAGTVDPERRSTADAIMTEGWVVGDHAPIDLDPAHLDWRTLCADDRSLAFRLHAWDFTGPVLRAYDDTGESRYLEWCRDLALSWVTACEATGLDGTMAWYDMALGLRISRLAHLIELLVLADAGSEVVDPLVRVMRRHQEEIVEERAFTDRNNHGFYVAVGQLMAARRLAVLPGMVVLAAQGTRRLARIAARQFAPDGGHLEHSPDYHRMLLRSFSAASAAGLLTDPGSAARVRLAEEALGWMVEPNGRIVQIGDTPARDMVVTTAITSSETTEFILSAGARGRPGTASMKVLPDSGYAFVRHPAPQGRDDHLSAAYLSFMAGFHSRTHKHADDLSFTWFDRGREIVVDTGRYGYVGVLPKLSPDRLEGYFYAAPERQYVESTRAHNTIEVDGRDHRRRGRDPYGSGIVDATERDGVFRLRGRVEHGDWTHERSLILHPGRWLVVQDTITGLHRPGTVRSWLNLPEDLDVEVDAEDAVRAEAGSEVLWIRDFGASRPIAPVRGQASPLRGWRSRKDLELTPAWSLGFEAAEVRAQVFRTVLAFDTRPERVPESPFD